MAEHLTWIDWFKIFDLAVGNPKATIVDAKKLIDKNRTTAARALRVAIRLIEHGIKPLDDKNAMHIAENVGYDTTFNFVSNAYFHYLSWRNDSSSKELLKKLHLENLIIHIGQLRSCLEHPKLEDLPDWHRLLDVRGYDWRLDPTTWFCLCTPDFSNEDSWEPEFPLLKSHMKDSPFWNHLEGLWQVVKSLEHDYDRMAIQLFEHDQHFRKFWNAIQIERLKRESGWWNRPSRTVRDPQPYDEDLKPYYDQKYAEEVIKRFEDAFGGFNSRQFELEKMLDQLYLDLLPDEINPIIVKGHCDKCPR